MPDLPCIQADTGMVEQIVMNLAANSRDAMPKGGKLIITTSVAEIDAAYVRQHPEARGGRVRLFNRVRHRLWHGPPGLTAGF